MTTCSTFSTVTANSIAALVAGLIDLTGYDALVFGLGRESTQHQILTPELRAQVAEAGVLRELGQAREARVRLDDCVTQLADLTYPPAHVEALMARANALADLGEVDAALADIDAAAPLAATAGDRAALASL